jgi:hypothetical protein
LLHLVHSTGRLRCLHEGRFRPKRDPSSSGMHPLSHLWCPSCIAHEIFAMHPTTPDGRYFVVKGQLWRCTNPSLSECERQRLGNRLANSPLSTQTSSDKNGWKTKPCPQVYPLNKPVSDVGHAEPASGSQSTMASLYTSAPHTP